jgi:hypothetical protein
VGRGADRAALIAADVTAGVSPVATGLRRRFPRRAAARRLIGDRAIFGGSFARQSRHRDV